jgi:hypothetical protein
MSNYNEKFIKKIEEITGFEYNLGIKMMIFKEKHTKAGNTKCLCSHKVTKYYIWTFQNKEYKIGCDCVKKHKGDFSEEQIKDLIKIDAKYKKDLENAKKEAKKKLMEEKKRIAEEEKEESLFLLNKVNWKGEQYILKNLIISKDLEKLNFYYRKYDKFQNEKDKNIFKRILKKILK